MTKKIAAVLCCFTVFSLLFAQESDFADLEEETQTQSKFDPALQRTFIMTASPAKLELNPLLSNYSNEAQIINSLQEGLFNYNPNTLEPVPALAKSYKISRDKKRWTFVIRNDARFSDVTPITAQSVIDSWLALQKTPGAPYASLIDCISGIKEYRETKGQHTQVGLKAKGQTLTVTLKTPAAHLSRLLCHHAFSVYSGNPEVFSGPYTVTENTDEKLVLTKNEQYWDKDNVAIKEIDIQFVEDKADAAWLFNTGRTDWIYSNLDASKILNKDSIRISAVFGTSYYFFTCRNPVWDNPEFRNALLAAAPWTKLREGLISPAVSLVYPLAGYPQVEGLSETNEEEALELMETAREKAGIPQDKILDLTFGIADNEYMMEVALKLREAWAPLGVNLIPFKIKEDLYLNSIPYLKYDLFCYSWIGDFADPLTFLELFKEGSTLNTTDWHNEKFNQLLKTAEETTDQVQRYKLLSQAEQVLLDDGMILPIGHSVSLHAINPKEIGGWYTNALDIHPFKYLFFKEYEGVQAPNIVKR